MYYTAVSQISISAFINMLIFDKLTQDMFRVSDGLVVGVRGALTRRKFDPHRFYDVVIAHVTIKLIGRIEKTRSSLCARWLVIRTHWVRRPTLRRRKPETTTRDKHSANALHRLP